MSSSRAVTETMARAVESPQMNFVLQVEKPCKHGDPVCGACLRLRVSQRKCRAGGGRDRENLAKRVARASDPILREALLVKNREWHKRKYANDRGWASRKYAKNAKWRRGLPTSKRLEMLGRLSLRRSLVTQSDKDSRYTRYKSRAIAYEGARRAKRMGCKVVELVFVDRLIEMSRGLCWVCGRSVDKSAPPHSPSSPTVDHVVPLRLFGEHSYVNTRLAHSRCNLSRAKPDRVGGYSSQPTSSASSLQIEVRLLVGPEAALVGGVACGL